MKKFVILSSVCMLSGLMLAGCERDQGVMAGYEQGTAGTYQPRPAPSPKAEVQQNEMTGELRRVDIGAKTFSIRVDNGMEQTFKFDNDTTVLGLQGRASIRDLIGKEGSEVSVRWQDSEGAKMAIRVDVTQVSASRSTRRTAKKTK